MAYWGFSLACLASGLKKGISSIPHTLSALQITWNQQQTRFTIDKITVNVSIPHPPSNNRDVL